MLETNEINTIDAKEEAPVSSPIGSADTFYIGWKNEAPSGLAAFMKKAIIGGAALAFLIGVLVATRQNIPATAVYEYGEVKTFEGFFRKSPYPHLLVARPGVQQSGNFSNYLLVAPFKFGVNEEDAERLDGNYVSLQGTLVYRGDQTMLEVAQIEDSDDLAISPGEAPQGIPTPPPSKGNTLGNKTFQGEIVDSKCYLGVMNPGNLMTHRGCAIRCISGGIPPVFLVRQVDGAPLYLLLTDEKGNAVNDRILDLVALPLEITGEVERHNEFLVLKANPATYRRLK